MFLLGVCLLALVIGITGCDTGTSSSASGAALLTRLTIDNTEVELKAPIGGDAYEDSGNSLNGLFTADFLAQVSLKDFTGNVITATVSPKAKAEFGAGSSNYKPADFVGASEVKLTSNGYLFIRVTSENGKTINYYAVRTQSISNTAELKSIQIGNGNADAKTGLDAAPAADTDFAELQLSKSVNTGNLKITLNTDASFRGKTEIAFKDTTFADFDKDKTYTFTDGDKIILKLTSQSGTTIKYYGFKISIGKDITLKSVTFGTDAADPGKSADDVTQITTGENGVILMEKFQPATGYSITVTPNDPDAKVAFDKFIAVDANSGKNLNVAKGTVTNTLKFDENSEDNYLVIKVESENGTVTKYYNIEVGLFPRMEIPYGTPTKLDGTDNIWSTKWGTKWVNIKKQNRAETTTDFYDNPSSKGKARLLWDEDGLWLFVDVTSDYMTTSGWANDHTDSSVELFINEAYPTVKTGNYNDIGGQYRLGTNKNVSGDPSAAANAMSALKQVNAWSTGTTAGDKHWYVLFQAPWRFTSTYPLKGGNETKQISLEIQINAVGANGRRIGVLKWYNTTANTYQNASALAEGTLLAKGSALVPLKPNITVQPVNQKVDSVATTSIVDFTVTGTSPDNGNITYKWYASSDGVKYDGTSALVSTQTYKPTTTTAGKTYYYAEIINTTGGGSRSAFSNIATLNIKDYSSLPTEDKVFSFNAKNTSQINAQYQRVHRLEFTGDFEADGYTKMSIDVVFYAADGTTVIEPGVSGQLTLKFYDSNLEKVTDDVYNVGSSNTTTLASLTNADIPAKIITNSKAGKELRFIDFDSSGQSQPDVDATNRIRFIEVKTITFHP